MITANQKQWWDLTSSLSPLNVDCCPSLNPILPHYEECGCSQPIQDLPNQEYKGSDECKKDEAEVVLSEYLHNLRDFILHALDAANSAMALILLETPKMAATDRWWSKLLPRKIPLKCHTNLLGREASRLQVSDSRLLHQEPESHSTAPTIILELMTLDLSVVLSLIKLWFSLLLKSWVHQF